MSWMIEGPESLTSTCYIELLPGPYRDRCWNHDSVYFREEHFCIFEKIILRHWPSYDHYAFTEISGSVWSDIIKEFERSSDLISEKSRFADVRDIFQLMSIHYEKEFMDRESENLRILKQTVVELASWLKKTLKDHGKISILGM